jgi:hypothetical protein
MVARGLFSGPWDEELRIYPRLNLDKVATA